MSLFKWRTFDANVSKFVTIDMKYEIWSSIVENKKKKKCEKAQGKMIVRKRIS